MKTSPDSQNNDPQTHIPAPGLIPDTATSGRSIELPPPATFYARLPLTTAESTLVSKHRDAIGTILQSRSRGNRMLAIVGPCSIHSVEQALDYADHLAAAQTRFSDALLIAMRVYIEKPRTTVGWRGLALDPSMDASTGPDTGLMESRRVMKGVIERGLPVATESLDPLIVPYVEDMLAFSSLGARTSESQTHRQMAAAMACPVGIKNATCGSLAVAADAAVAVQSSQPVFRLTKEGRVVFEEVQGNPNTAIVLRGGAQGPNYTAEHQVEAQQLLHQRAIDAGLIVDCSHGNSGKVASRQAKVIDYISSQIRNGENSPAGVMIESNLHGGKQPAGTLATLQYGVSVTDECMSFDDTLSCLEKLADAVRRTSTQQAESLATA
jgi:3-deoxy-7-phosphoheptulonate synthase